jgi:hypothetical protein
MNIYVGSLSYEVTEEELKQAFGTVANQRDSDLWRCLIRPQPSLRSRA